eukprot:gene26293-34918_t
MKKSSSSRGIQQQQDMQKPLPYQSYLLSLMNISKFLTFGNIGCNESEFLDDVEKCQLELSDYGSRNISIDVSVSCGGYSIQDGDYGYFDDSSIADDHHDSFSISTRSFFEERTISNNGREDDKNVICALENGIAPIICRSFQSLSNFKRTIAHISLPGFRIVQDERGEAAEFKFVLSINGTDYVAWRKFSDFRKLAMACIEFSKMKNSTLSFNSTINAWNEVVNNRPWFYQCLNINYLIEKSLLLETFMKNLFFEVSSVDIMLEFVCDE